MALLCAPGLVGAAGFNFTRLYELAEGYGTTNTPLQDSLFYSELSGVATICSSKTGYELYGLVEELKIAIEVYPAIAQHLIIHLD